MPLYGLLGFKTSQFPATLSSAVKKKPNLADSVFASSPPRCSTAFSQPEEAVALRVDRKYDLLYSKWTAVRATDFANSQIM